MKQRFIDKKFIRMIEKDSATDGSIDGIYTMSNEHSLEIPV